MDPVGSINLVPISQKDAEEASKNSIPNEERSNHEVKMNTLSLMNQGRRGSLLLLTELGIERISDTIRELIMFERERVYN